VNIISENEKIVEEAVKTHALGESVHWAVTLSVVPGPNGQPTPVLLLFISIPGINLGERMVAQTMAGVGIDPAIEHMVGDMIEQLKGARATAAATALNPSAPSNGHGEVRPGLIDPRQGL